MGKKGVAAAALDPEQETYVVHFMSLSSTPLVVSLDVHPFRKPQISDLIAKEAPTKVPAKYSDFADVFSSDLMSKLSEYTGINDHAIELVDGCQQPTYGPIYSLGPVELKTLKAYIETNLANSFIKLSKSPAGTLILFDRKPDGFLWLCVDYRGLNNLTIKNQYLLPLIGELLDRLRRAKQFTQLNLISAYLWMRIRERDKWKTTFRTWYGHFEYQVMLFGLTNIPASFQGYINKIFAEKLAIFVIVYLDNIFIFTNDDKDEHITAVRWVLEQLTKFLLHANLKKCWFYQEKVWFFGYVVSLKSIRMEDKRIEAVKQWPKLQSVQDIQIFLGFANFYQWFIQGFIWITAPLTLILKTLRSTKSKTWPGEGGVGVDASRAGRDDNGPNESGINNSEVDGGEVGDDEVEKKGRKMSKSKNLSKSKKW